jgi:putative oxidoreductase
MPLSEGPSSIWTSRMLSILRIVVGVLFIEHGTQKMFGIPHGQMPPVGLTLASQMGLAAILEMFGGIAIFLGLFTRPVAFLLSGEMAVAYFQVHMKRGFLPIQNGGDNVVLFSFIFLYFVFAGGGVWSVDHLLARSRRTP